MPFLGKPLFSKADVVAIRTSSRIYILQPLFKIRRCGVSLVCLKLYYKAVYQVPKTLETYVVEETVQNSLLPNLSPSHVKAGSRDYLSPVAHCMSTLIDGQDHPFLSEAASRS